MDNLDTTLAINNLANIVAQLGANIDSVRRDVNIMKVQNESRPARSSPSHKASKTTCKDKLTPSKTKIFTDLIRACKEEPRKNTHFRTHSLVRRKDVLALYGNKRQAYLRKAGILALFHEASAHGFGVYVPSEGLFLPNQQS